jgi:hypothetical protein
MEQTEAMSGFLKLVVRAPGSTHAGYRPTLQMIAAAVHQRSVGEGQPVFLVGK